MTVTTPERKIAAASAVVSLLVASLAWAVFGILRTPDTLMYLQYADQLHAGALPLAGPMPVSLFRTPGFPAILAALQWLAPHAWPALLVSLQLAAVALTAALTTATAHRLGASHRLACLAGALPSLGFVVVLEIAVIPDALYAALAAGAAFALLRHRPLTAGLLLALALLLREATIVLMIFYVPLACAEARPGALPLDPTKGRRPSETNLTGSKGLGPLAGLGRAQPCLILLLPPILAAASLITWNVARGAGPVLTTSRQIVMLQAILPLLPRHPDVLGADTPFEHLARATLSGPGGMDRMNELQRQLGAAGWTAPRIATAASAAYAATWAHHPLPMLATTLGSIRHEYLAMPFQPIDTLGALAVYAGWPRPSFDRLNILWSRHGDPAAALIILLDVATRLVGTAIGLAGLIGPWLPGRAWRLRALWCIPVGFVAVYAPVHIETRYLAPVVPLVTILAAASLKQARPEALPLDTAGARGPRPQSM